MGMCTGPIRTRALRAVATGLAAALATSGLVVAGAGSAAAAPAPVLFTDTFSDGDAAGWRTSGGQWSVVDAESKVLQQASISAQTQARAGDPSWVDYSADVRVRTLAVRDRRAWVSVLARVQPDGSHYYLATRADDTVEIGKVVRGRTTTLATAFQPSDLQGWRSLRLVVEGTTLLGLVDENVVLTVTDGQLSRGRAGVGTRYARAQFDDVTVRSHAAPPPDTVAPQTPAAPTIVDVTPTTATITWQPTVDNVGVTEYVVYQGGQFYEQYAAMVLVGTGPVTLNLNPTAAFIHFSVAARDAAGNTSPISSRVRIPQPPSFPRTGDDAERPTAPGTPAITGRAPDGQSILSWTPATDNVGIVEYHVILVINIDEVRVLARSTAPSATVWVTGSDPRVQVVAYDAAWNSASSALVPYGPGPTPTPTVN